MLSRWMPLAKTTRSGQSTQSHWLLSFKWRRLTALSGYKRCLRKSMTMLHAMIWSKQSCHWGKNSDGQEVMRQLGSKLQKKSWITGLRMWIAVKKSSVQCLNNGFKTARKSCSKKPLREWGTETRAEWMAVSWLTLTDPSLKPSSLKCR